MASFKDSYGAASEFKGGMVPPEKIQIVGLDVEPEDWNQDLWDKDRLALSRASLDTPEGQAFVDSILRYGVTDEIKVKRRREVTLAVDGRRRIMGARRANQILTAQKAKHRILVPIVIDQTADQTVAMRLGNVHRLDDPPYVKAAQAEALRRQGVADKDIALLLGCTLPTLGNWKAYMQCVPEIRRLVEMPDAGAEPLPFAVAYEIGKIGPSEKAKQLAALEALKKGGAKLTGETGRANANAVAKRQREPRAPNSNSTPAPIVTAAAFKPTTINALLAVLEPTADEPWDDDFERLAYQIALVLAGQDPDAEGLKEWKGIHIAFHQALGLGKRGKK